MWRFFRRCEPASATVRDRRLGDTLARIATQELKGVIAPQGPSLPHAGVPFTTQDEVTTDA